MRLGATLRWTETVKIMPTFSASSLFGRWLCRHNPEVGIRSQPVEKPRRRMTGRCPATTYSGWLQSTVQPVVGQMGASA